MALTSAEKIRRYREKKKQSDLEYQKKENERLKAVKREP